MTNHVSYLFLANLVTIVSQVVFAPLLTRYYTPEAYGLFSAFISAGINISTILSLRYENALLLETNEKNRNLIAGMIVTLGFAGGLLMTIFILSFPGFLSQLVGTGNSTLILLMIPVFVVVNIFFIVTGVEVTLTNKYRDSFIYGSPAMVGSKVYSLAYSVFINGHFAGLFTSDIISRLALVIIRLTISLKKGVKSYLIISHQQVMAGLLLLKKYRRFPIYDLPATYINIFVGQAPVYFLTALKQTAILGWLGISLSMLEMPLRLMSYSIAPVLMQRASSMVDKPAEYQKLLERIISLIFLASIVPAGILFIWGQDIFSFVFGKNWAQSGLIASSFILFYTFRFELDILHNVMAAQGLQKKKFVISITEGLARIGLLILTYLIVKDALQTIIFWAYECAVIYFFVTLFTYRLMDLKLKRLVILKVTMVLLFISIFLWKHFI